MLQRDLPIINSFLDTDFYQFSMGQFVWKHFPDVQVTYGFRNRTRDVILPDLIDIGELREQLDHCRSLRMTRSELHYLGGTYEYEKRMFEEEYIKFLAQVGLPEYNLERDGNTYRLEFAGPWSTGIYWETIALPVITELYGRSQMKGMTQFEKDCVIAGGKIKLAQKIAELKKYPGLTFSDFGTRRRFSRTWQDYIDSVLTEEMPEQFRGTSNVYLAMKYGLMPMGTNAHQLYMILAAIMDDGTDESVQASQWQVYRMWWEMYGHGLSIALPDTFGSDFFFENAPPELARDWKGSRQDSMDPYHYGQKAINFYKKHGVDSSQKLVIFSDGLEVPLMIKLYLHFRRYLATTNGWGTNLTNDMGFRPLSLIIKPVLANGRGTVKLSDNIAKATGKPEDIERMKRIFKYTSALDQKCTY